MLRKDKREGRAGKGGTLRSQGKLEEAEVQLEVSSWLWYLHNGIMHKLSYGSLMCMVFTLYTVYGHCDHAAWL